MTGKSNHLAVVWNNQEFNHTQNQHTLSLNPVMSIFFCFEMGMWWFFGTGAASQESLLMRCSIFLCRQVGICLWIYPLNPYVSLFNYTATVINAHEIFPFYFIYFSLHAISIFFWINSQTTLIHCAAHTQKKAISF